MPNRVAIFGIDGGTLSLVKKWKDDLPVLGNVMNNGASGELMSTVPALTCPAWPAMFTGKNPGRLGMFDFISKGGRIFDASDYAPWALWNIISRYGKTVGLLNVPMTYPLTSVNGYVVAGLGVPNESADYVYPRELKAELPKGYQVIPNVMLTLKGQEEKCIKSCSEVLSKRIEAAKYLVKNYPTDFFACVFFVSDVVQHYFWNHAGKYGGVIKDIYMKIDKTIGELMEGFNYVFIVSDHGFAECKGIFFLNEWLEEHGYLRYKKQDKPSVIYSFRDYLLSHMSWGMTHRISEWLPDKIANRLRTSGELINRSADFRERVDWEHTVAYADGMATGGIYVIGEDCESAKAEITDGLIDLGYKVYNKADVFCGEYVTLAPDISIELGSNSNYPLAFKTKHYAISGSHAQKGLFMGFGTGVKKQEVSASIYDITPTVLELFGIPIPTRVDGRPLTEIWGEV